MNGTNEGNCADPGPTHDKERINDLEAKIIALYKSEYRGLRGYVRKHVDDPNWIEDIVQDAFLEVAKRWAEIREPRAYLYKVAHNRLQTTIYRRLALLPEDNSDDRVSYSHVDRRLDVRAAIAKLTQRQTQVVHLYYFADYPLAQIAEILLIDVGTVKHHLHVARETLEDLLGPNPPGNMQ